MSTIAIPELDARPETAETQVLASWMEQTSVDLPAGDDGLNPAEAHHLSLLKVPKRRADWRLGRWTAKHVVAAYLDLAVDPRTLASIVVRPAPSGAPQVFLGGRPAALAISLSHREGIAACAVAPAGTAIGCDLEIVEPRCDAFLADYFTEDEQRLFAQVEADCFLLAALFWSAKEAALKALGAGLQMDPRWLEVSLAGRSPAQESDIWLPLEVRCEHDQAVRGWWQHQEKLVRTLVTDPAPARPLVIPPPPRLHDLQIFTRV